MSNGSIALTTHQLAALLVLEAQAQQLQIGANQLGGFLKLKAEADILVEAIALIQRKTGELRAQWARTVQIVDAASMPAAPVINGKPTLVKP